MFHFGLHGLLCIRDDYQTDPVMYVRATRKVIPNMIYRNQLLAKGCMSQKLLRLVPVL